MAEHLKPLSLAEEAFIALATQIRDEARAKAMADFGARMRVFAQQFGIPEGAEVSVIPRVGPMPAHLQFDAPSATDLGDKESAISSATS